MPQIPVNWLTQSLSKSCCMINLILSHKFTDQKGNSYKCIFNKVSHKNNCVHAFSALIFHCVSLVNPDSSFYCQIRVSAGASLNCKELSLNGKFNFWPCRASIMYNDHMTLIHKNIRKLNCSMLVRQVKLNENEKCWLRNWNNTLKFLDGN